MLPELIEPPVLAPEIFDIDRLAERLATGGFALMKDVFPEDLLTALQDVLLRREAAAALAPAGVGRGDDFRLRHAVRSDLTCWIDGDAQAEQRFLARLEDLRLEVNSRLMMGLFDVEAHYAVYPAGAFYRRHVDSFRGARNRLLSLVLYLNRGWRLEDGGELLIFGEEEGAPALARILPEWGHVACFLSETVPHEVRVTHRVRHSIAVWYRCHQPVGGLTGMAAVGPDAGY